MKYYRAKTRVLKTTLRIRFELIDALMTHSHTSLSTQLRLRSGMYLFAVLLWALPAWADEAADQLERAGLMREFQETPSRASAPDAAPSLPAATIEMRR